MSFNPSGLMWRFNSGSISLVIPGGGSTSRRCSGLSFFSSSMVMNIVKVTSAGMQRSEWPCRQLMSTPYIAGAFA